MLTATLRAAGPQIFFEVIFERRVVQQRLRQRPLKPPVLVLQRLEAAGCRDAEPTHFDLHFYNVALEIPYRLQTFSVFAPTSYSRSTR
jgi:hypothetical protein